MINRRTPRWLYATLCALLGTTLVTGLLAFGDGDVPVACGVPPSTEEQADQSARESAVRAQRGAHLDKIGIERWHKAGHKGHGVRVAVLDTGFRGWKEHLGKSLPDQVAVKSFRNDANLEGRDSQHGILCGEVVHALAPEADLLFANWEPDDPETFLDAVRWAGESGASVITCSIIMPGWGDGEGGGPVHAALTKLLGDGDRPADILCFASAGNTAKRHWSGTFTRGADGWHEWIPGRTTNALTPWGTELVSLELSWRAEADFEILVTTSDGQTTAHCLAAMPGEVRHNARVRFQPDLSKSYRVSVRQVRGDPCSFHFTSLASGLDLATSAGSVCFPADGPEVIAVGAVDEEGRRMSYSSCGPNSPRQKPDLVATVPFPSLWRDRPFAGTSAAAPQAAAVAALWRSRHPDWSAKKVREWIAKTARDVGAPGPDLETGYGLIQLPRE
jgi:subtilisin family serine protease